MTKTITFEISLAATHPWLLKDWDFEANEIGPDEVFPGTNKKVKWICDFEHKWSATPNNRALMNSGCPYCIGQKACLDNCFAKLYPDLLDEWDFDKNSKLPTEITQFSNYKANWICENGHKYIKSVKQRTARGVGCQLCFDRQKSVFEHIWLTMMGISDDVAHRQVKIVVGKCRFYVDGYDPEIHTVYEFNGDFYHGNPKYFALNDINPVSNKKNKFLFAKTQFKLDALRSNDYIVASVWESDFVLDMEDKLGRLSTTERAKIMSQIRYFKKQNELIKNTENVIYLN